MAKCSKRNDTDRPQIIVRIAREKLGRLNKTWNWKSMRVGKKKRIETKIADVQPDNVQYESRLVLKLSKINVTNASSASEDSSSNSDEEDEEIVPGKITHYKKDLIRKHSSATLQRTCSVSERSHIAGCENKIVVAQQETCNPVQNDKNEICNEKENTVNISDNISTVNLEQTNLDMIDDGRPKIRVLENTMLSGPSSQFPHPTFNIRTPNGPNVTNTSNEQDRSPIGKHVLPPVMLPQQQSSRIAVPLNGHSVGIQRQNSMPINVENRKVSYPNVVIQRESENDKNVQNGEFPMLPPIRSNPIKRKQTFPIKRASTVVDHCNTTENVPEMVKRRRGRPPLKKRNETNGLASGVACPNNDQSVPKPTGEILAQLLGSEKKRYPEVPHGMPPPLMQQSIPMNNKETEWNHKQNHMSPYNFPLPYHGIPRYPPPLPPPLQIRKQSTEDPRSTSHPRNEQAGVKARTNVFRPPPSYYNQHILEDNAVQYPVRNVHEQPAQTTRFQREALPHYPFNSTVQNVDLVNPGKKFEIQRPDRVYSQRSAELYRHLLENSLRATKERAQPISVIRSNDLENYNPDLRYIPPAPNVEPELQMVERNRNNQEFSAPKTPDIVPRPATDSNKTSEQNETRGRVYFQCFPEQLADIIVDRINEKTSKTKDDKNRTNEIRDSTKSVSSVKFNVIKENPAASIHLNQKGSTYKIENLLNPHITKEKKEIPSDQISQSKTNVVAEVRKDRFENEGALCPIENPLERPKSAGVVVEIKTVKVDMKNASTSPLPYNELIAGEGEGNPEKIRKSMEGNETDPEKSDISKNHVANELKEMDDKKNFISNEDKNVSSTSNENDTISLCDSCNGNDEEVVIKREPFEDEVQDFDPNEPIENVFAKIMSNCFKVLNLVNEMQNMNESNSRHVDPAVSLSKIRQGLRGVSIFLRRSRKLVEELETGNSFTFLVNCLASFRNKAKKIVETDYTLRENYISTSEVVIYRDVFMLMYEYMSSGRFNEQLKMRRNLSGTLPDILRDVKKEDDTSPSPDEGISSTYLKYMLEEYKRRRIAEEERNEILRRNIRNQNATPNKSQSDEDHKKFEVPFDDVKENLEAYRLLLNQSRGLKCQDSFKTLNYSLADGLKRKANVILIDSDSDEDTTATLKQKQTKKQKVNNTIKGDHTNRVIHIDDEDENDKCTVIEIHEDSNIKIEIKCEEEDSTEKTPEIPTQQIDFKDSAKKNEESPRKGEPEENPPDGLQKISVVNMKEISNLGNCETIEAIKRFLKETEVEILNSVQEVQPEKNAAESERKTSNHNAENKLVGIATPNVKETEQIKKTINHQIRPVNTSENSFCNEAKQKNEIVSKLSQASTLNETPQENLSEKQMVSKDIQEVIPTGNEHEELGSKCRQEAIPIRNEHEQMVLKDKQEAMPTENKPRDNAVQIENSQTFPIQNQNQSNVLTPQEDIFGPFWKNHPATDENSKILVTVPAPDIISPLNGGESPNFPITKNIIENSIVNEHISTIKEVQSNGETRTPSPISKQGEKKILFTTREYSSLLANHLQSEKVQNDGVRSKQDKLTQMGDRIGLLNHFSKQELLWNRRNPTFSKPILSPGTNLKITINTATTTPMEIKTNKTNEELRQSDVQKNPEDLRQTVAKTPSSQTQDCQAQEFVMSIPSLQLIYNDSVNTNGFISQYIKEEIGTLSKKESLSPCEYVQEVTTLLQLPLIPKDFKDFYIFVTKQQILQFHQPITFYIFLELLNQSGLKDYHKKFTEYTKRKYEDGLKKVFKDQQLRKKT